MRPVGRVAQTPVYMPVPPFCGGTGVESKKGRTVDAWAPEGDERRGKLRKSAGRCMRPVIRGCLNGATRRADGPTPAPLCVRGLTPGTETS